MRLMGSIPRQGKLTGGLADFGKKGESLKNFLFLIHSPHSRPRARVFQLSYHHFRF